MAALIERAEAGEIFPAQFRNVCDNLPPHVVVPRRGRSNLAGNPATVDFNDLFPPRRFVHARSIHYITDIPWVPVNCRPRHDHSVRWCPPTTRPTSLNPDRLHPALR